MFEIAIVLIVVAGATALIGRSRHFAPIEDDDDAPFVDLPCPWCQAPTAEDDTACPSCQQPFAVAS